MRRDQLLQLLMPNQLAISLMILLMYIISHTICFDMLLHYSNQVIMEESEDRELASAIKQRITQKITLYAKPKKNHKQTNLILGALKNHFLFYNLSDEELENVKDKMLSCDIREGDTIFSEGEIGHCFFIINKGKVNIEVEGVVKKQLTHQNGFGELALLYNTSRTTTARAKTDVNLWVIDRQSFREAVDEIATKEFEDNRKCLETVSFFNNLTHEQKDLITSALTVQRYSKGQAIIQEGDPGSSLFIIKEGNVSIEKNGKEVKKLSAGDSFGEQSLYYNTMRLMTVKAEDDVVCLVLGRDNLSRVFNDKVHNITFRNFIKTAFQKSKTLSNLTKEQMEHIAEIMHINSYKAGEAIYKRGMTPNKIIVMFEGNLVRFRNNQVEASKGKTYGELFLSAGYKNRTIEDELVIDSDGVVAELSFDHLNLCLSNCRLEEVIERNNQEIERRMTHLENKLIKVSKELELRDLIFHEKLNDGVFGAVLRVSSTALMTNYVLKVYSKKRVAEEDIIKLIASQKKILERIGNPFIVSLAKTFVNADNYYFLMEYVRGADLLDVMKEIGLLSSNDSKFLVATMIYILQYLHYHGIIHRDFKPENFMITEHGYLKLIEMLTAKALKNKAGRTFTILGTPHYMAPEIMVNKGYSTYVDLWSVGVMLYEMLCGVMPFGEDTSTPNDIYEDILKDNLRFPTTLKDKKARKLIEQLLSRNPESRLGGSYASLMSHPWLQNFDWVHLAECNIKNPPPPIIPHLKSKEDEYKSSLGVMVHSIGQRAQSWPDFDHQ